MKISLVAVGRRMPAWVEAGVREYSGRLPRNFELNIIEIPLSHRGKNTDLQRAIDREGEDMLAAIAGNEHVIALDVNGCTVSTEDMAHKIGRIRDKSVNIAMLAGGPDGLAKKCLQRADDKWSLSALTLPHPIVRIVTAEQIYRVWSFLNNHPYHRS